MDPLTISLIAGGIQTGFGAIQRASANKRRKEALDSLKYEIPDATKEQVKIARGLASQKGLPGEDITRSRVESDIAGTISKGESVSQAPSDILGLYAQMFGKKTDFEKQLGEQGAQYEAQQKSQLINTLNMAAEAENQRFYYNKFVPFLSDMGYASEEAMGGASNISGGLQTAFAGLMGSMSQPTVPPMNGSSVSMSSNGGSNRLNRAREIYSESLAKLKSFEPNWINQSLGNTSLQF